VRFLNGCSVLKFRLRLTCTTENQIRLRNSGADDKHKMLTEHVLYFRRGNMWTDRRRSFRLLTSALFWNFTQRRVCYRRFGTTYRIPSQEHGPDRLPQNVSNKLPFYVAQNPRRRQISFPSVFRRIKIFWVQVLRAPVIDVQVFFGLYVVSPGIYVFHTTRCNITEDLNLPNFFFFCAVTQRGQVRLIHEVSLSHSDTPQSEGLLWTSDQPHADTST